MISTVQAQWNSATMRVQIEKACAAEAIWRLELGKVRRTAEPLPAKVRRGEIDFRLRAGGTIPSLKSRLSNKHPWCGESQFCIYHTKWEAHVRMVRRGATWPSPERGGLLT